MTLTGDLMEPFFSFLSYSIISVLTVADLECFNVHS